MTFRLLLVVAATLCLYGVAQGKLQGVVYEPFSPRSTGICLDSGRVAKDLAAISKVADSIRLRSIATCSESTMAIMKFAKKNGMTVMLGLYISDSDEDNTSELKMLSTILKAYNGKVVAGVVVGDEVTSTSKITDKGVARFINRAKAMIKKLGMKIPVGTAETWNILEFSSDLNSTIAASDFLCMNMQPYWGGIPAQCAFPEDCTETGVFVDQKAAVIAMIHNMEVKICNTGWPTLGEECCGIGREGTLDGFQAVPNVGALDAFVSDVHGATKNSGRTYYIGDAFDAEWKRTHVPCEDCLGLSTEFGCGAKKKKDRECEVAYHFGLHTAEGKLKEIGIPE
ncbi:hypothetical protein BSKO_11689 [Bryopsis sp. KO-2023]|nr:hypothetical protein BSKO_11689 [Bryopsis sp. KO-2023]